MTTRAPAVLKMFGGAEVMCLAMTRYVFSQQPIWSILLHPDCVGGRCEQPHGHLDHSPSLHKEPLALKGLLENNVYDIYTKSRLPPKINSILRMIQIRNQNIHGTHIECLV